MESFTVLLLAAPAVCLAASLLAVGVGMTGFRHVLPPRRLGWLLAMAPLAAFGMLLAALPVISGGKELLLRLPWLPSLGLSAVWYLDGLSALFALLITGIGALVLIYTGYYFEKQPDAWRFMAYLLLFLVSMLGMVLAGDIVTLFIFWEGTSITSFLLIGYNRDDPAARRGALKALLITGGGGIALLAGLLVVNSVAGSYELPQILQSGDLLRSSSLYPLMLSLLALGAVTKSAQTPFHVWLPDAMSAPTPASTYLHSATMVKAGLYLMARFNPALGGTDLWFWLLSLFGLATMLTGAYLGLRQHDLKALLAYSTVSQLGILMMLIGQDSEIAFKALVIGVLAHALYKSALFLIAGIVDHGAGTRDLRRLGGLAHEMRYSLAIGGIAALSMAGLPPLFGFLAKETLLATVTHPSVPYIADLVFTAAAITAGALLLAQAAIFLIDTFLGRRRDPGLHPHEAPAGMLLAPAIPALLSLLVGLIPEPAALAAFLADAAGAAYGGKVKVSLAIWTGINPPLLLSLLAITLGTLIFLNRRHVRSLQDQLQATLASFSWNAIYERSLRLVDWVANLSVRTQSGHLRRYLFVILVSALALMALFGELTLKIPDFQLPALSAYGEILVLRFFTLFLTAAAAFATIALRRNLLAVLALSASGLGVAILMVLEPAPDVALVQVVVDILITIIFVLALMHMPHELEQQTERLSIRKNWRTLLRDSILAVSGGALMTLVALNALATRPRPTLVTPFYENNAKLLTGARDVVGAIIVDFRAFDTLIEITVFAMAGVGIYTLLRYVARRDREAPDPRVVLSHSPGPEAPSLLGVAGPRPSPVMRLLIEAALPLAFMIAAIHMMYGHDQPGDGFTAGVIVSMAVGLWVVFYGFFETRRRLPWLRPPRLISAGLLLALASAVLAAIFGGSFFAPVDFGKLAGLPLPEGFNLSTSFLFEVAIFLVVMGSATWMLAGLTWPTDYEGESVTVQDLTAPTEESVPGYYDEVSPVAALPAAEGKDT